MSSTFEKPALMACWNLQVMSTLAMLLWASQIRCQSTAESEIDCIPAIKVPRNTVWVAAAMDILRLNCTLFVERNCLRNLTILWCKVADSNQCTPVNLTSYITTELTNISENNAISYLIFRNLSIEDTGLYRCSVEAPVSIVSHAISVTVTKTKINTEDVDNKENNTTNSSESGPKRDLSFLWPYMYICSGILLMVIVVITIPLIIIKCQGHKQSKKKKTAENQSSAIQLAPSGQGSRGNPLGNTHSLPAQLKPPSPCIYDNKPIRASSQKIRPAAGRPPSKPVAQRQNHNCGNVPEEEEERPLIYASLNHKALTRGQVRISPPETETSEYAAIRVS